jgi:hypothetical protein
MTDKTVKWATPLVTFINENKISNDLNLRNIIGNNRFLLKNIFLILFLFAILGIIYYNCKSS